ncbi:MAG: bifunctional phosphoribosylaminoimidazolecarboxamide formyltransferase/IMP cyclohydrolase [Bacteroidota bacterium]
MQKQKISSALLSVYHKEGLEPLVRALHSHGVSLVSTGGTLDFITRLGIPVQPVDDLTGYPSIFGGRVKTLHPKVFGGILQRRNHAEDAKEAAIHSIPPIDLVIVDLYPFEATVAAGGTDEEIIEKIDIGGISLIRAAAKNFNDVLIVSDRDQYADVLAILEQGCETTLLQRRNYAAKAFDTSSHYDTAIFNWFNRTEQMPVYKYSLRKGESLRYGENPHQNAEFFADVASVPEQLHGKAISYNNLVDIDASLALIDEFADTPGVTFAIIKHTNACGVATAHSAARAYKNALTADPISAFGGVIVSNSKIDMACAQELNMLFFEVLTAPDYEPEALELLKSKKNRILLKRRANAPLQKQIKTLMGGVAIQDADLKTETREDLQPVTKRSPNEDELKGLLFAAKICKHTKSNAIVLAREGQLLASGTGQTNRVDALKQAIEKARLNDFDLNGAVMASDAFFPFPDCVEIAGKAGITAVIQPGGSLRDQESIDKCNSLGMAMVITGTRHFKH